MKFNSALKLRNMLLTQNNIVFIFPVIYNSAMLGEMVILGILARLLYKKELPDIGLAEVPKPQEICIIADKYYSMIEKSSKGKSSKDLEQYCWKQFPTDGKEKFSVLLADHIAMDERKCKCYCLYNCLRFTLALLHWETTKRSPNKRINLNL